MDEMTDPVSIPFHRPALPDIDRFLEDARAIVESGRLSIGPYVERLEEAMRPWTGAPANVAVSNCSDGLIAALQVLGRAGGEVIIPGFTFMATWQSVLWAGMVPVVADVTEDGLLDPAAVAAAITSRTCAIVPVHMGGAPAPMAELRIIADAHGFVLIADAAHALGARRAGRPVGTDGDAEVFSIGATKQLGAGEGGIIALRNDGDSQAVRLFAGQGHVLGQLDAIRPGMNLRMQELTAALALRLLESYDAQLARRQWIHAQYQAAWRGLPLRLAGPRHGDVSAFKDQVVWTADAGDAARLGEYLAQAGIETRPYYHVAIPDMTAFAGIVSSADRSRALAARSMAVPIHARLTDANVERVAETVCAFFGRQ